MTKRFLPGAFFLIWSLPNLAAADTLKIEVERAEAGTDSYTSQPIVTVELNPESRKAFGEFTGARVGEPVKLRLGEQTLSTPIIREPITQGVLVISGQMTREDAQRLAESLGANGASLEVDGSDR